MMKMRSSIPKKSRFLLSALLLLAALCVPVYAAGTAEVGSPFSDVAGEAYYYGAVLEMAGDGVVEGYEDGSFQPDGTVTHAEVLAMLCRLAGIDVSGHGKPNGPWYSAAASWAELACVLQGDEALNEPATREEIARYITLVYRLTRTEGDAFSDMGRRAYANTLWTSGIAEGYEDARGRLVFGGKDKVKRCDVCLMLSRLKSKAGVPDWSGLSAEEPFSVLRLYLHDQIWNGVETIIFDTADYGSPDEQEFHDLQESLFMVPDLFILDGFSHSYAGSYHRLTPWYRSDYLADYENARALYIRELDAITAQVDEDWNDLQKLVFLNSYLATHYEYDFREDEAEINFDTYGFLRDGRGVCQAYSEVLKALLDRLGIPCAYVESESLDHLWNAVRVDGKWYHLDVTWDDPVPDQLGVSHFIWFLRSTETMRTANEGEHFARDDWSYSDDQAVCTDRTYDNSFFQDVISPFVPYDDGMWYCVSGDGLLVWDGVSATAKTLVSFSDQFDRWYPSWTFHGYASGSGLFESGGWLYFNSGYNVLRYNPSTGKTERIYDTIKNGSWSGERLYGCCLEDGVLVWQDDLGQLHIVELPA